MNTLHSKILIVFSIIPILVLFYIATSPFLFTDSYKGQKHDKTATLIDGSRCPQNIELTDKVVSQSLQVSKQRLIALKEARSLSNHDLCFMPQKKLARAFYRLDTPKTDKPDEWAKYRAMQQMSENGEVRIDGLSGAISHRHKMLERSDNLLRRGGINKDKWESIGPGNIGGRIRSILIHPTQPNKIWVGSVSGGIWHTKNGGESWSPVNDFMGNLSITSIIMDPSDTNIMYAATGEGFTYDFKGAGIFKSIDEGKSWKQLAVTKPSKGNWKYVNRIAIHPYQSNILLAATNNGLFRSSDFGDNWKKIVSDYQFYDVKFNPNDGQYVIATARKLNKNRSKRPYYIFYSSTSGQQWDKKSKDYKGRIELAYSKSQVNTVYASVNDNKGKIYRSNNNGKTWNFLSNPKHLGNQGWYDNTIWIDPTDSQHLIVGGISLYYSNDGGVNWQLMRKKWNSWGIHGDHHAIVEHPDYDGVNNRVVFFGNDGGIYKSNNIRGKTRPISLNNHLSITQFYSGAGHDGKNQRIIGGTQDNGTLIYTGKKNKWTWFEGGDGSGTAINPNDGNYIYGAIQFLNLYRSKDGGKTVTYICKGIKDLKVKKAKDGEYQYPCNDGSGSTNFISHFILDPNNSNCLIAGASSLWRTCNVNDKKPLWKNIKPPINEGYKYKYWGYINALAIAKKNSNIIWIGHNDGTLYSSRNGKAQHPSWQRKGENQLPKRMSLSLLIDNKNTNRIYASFGGYEADNLYISNNNGNTWKSISNGLPKSPIHTIQQHPQKQNWLYVGTEVGVFTSENGGKTWTAVNDGPANVPVFQLFWLNNHTLVAATHGRGMFTVTVGNKKYNTALFSPQLTAPRGVISYYNPYYQWVAVDDVDQYEINIIHNKKVIFQKKFKASEVCNQEGDCSFWSENPLKKGRYQWRVKSYQGKKQSNWNSSVSFEIDPSKKAQKAKLYEPSGNIHTQKPLYRWVAAKRASHYLLQVSDSSLKLDYEHKIIYKWYSARELGCHNGNTCSIRSKIALPLGKHRWRVGTYNSTGFGYWSDSKTMNVTSNENSEIVPVLVSPKNVVSVSKLYFQWKFIENIDFYKIRIKQKGKRIFQTKIYLNEIDCSDGYCGLVVDKLLKKGDYQWQMRAYKGKKKNKWSALLNFTVDPSRRASASQLLSPEGNLLIRKPTYRWKVAKKASHYFLWVSDSSLKSNYENKVISRWYSAEELGCNNDNTCSIRPEIALPLGKHRWWVGTYNSTGFGYWSDPKTILIIN